MTTTNFPNGLTSFGVPLIGSGPSIPVTNGTYYFVCNATGMNGSDGNDGTDMAAPMATLNGAYDKVTASMNDVIIVLPGHAETLASNTALVLDTANVSIIGLGQGSARPTFTLNTANTNRIPISAANIKIQGCIFIGNFLSIATLFLLTTAPNCTIDSCVFRDTSAVLGFLSIVTTTVTVNADYLTYTNNFRSSDATTTPGPDIVIAGTMTGLTVVGNKSFHNTISNDIAALVEHGALVMTNLMVGYNIVYSVNTESGSGALLVKTTATTGSGQVYNNYACSLETASTLLVTAAATQYGEFENYFCDRATFTSGFILPAIGAN